MDQMDNIIQFEGWRSKTDARIHARQLQAKVDRFLAEVWWKMAVEEQANRDQIHAMPPVEPVEHPTHGLDKLCPTLPGMKEHLAECRAYREAHRLTIAPKPAPVEEERSFLDFKIDLSDVHITLG